MRTAILLNAPKMDDDITESDVIVADGGYRFKDKLKDKNIVAVVGDFDSLGYEPEEKNVIKLSPEKNLTDGERAVILAKEKGYTEIVIYGAYGGKIEHILGNIALLKIAKNLGMSAEIKDGDFTTELISGRWQGKVKKGGSLSLIPYGGDCVFNFSHGLYYTLDNLTLTNGDTRGISNVATAENVKIDIKSGESLVIFNPSANL